MKINTSLLLSAYLLTHVSALWATPIQEIDSTPKESNLPRQVLEHVGEDFLRECTSLTTFDTRGLFTLTSIGVDFLSRCPSLSTFATTPPLNGPLDDEQ
jgi:hypothetical protein